jgi:predicted amidophosphoribosyltransferase
MSGDSSYEKCPNCNEPPAPGKKYCADCGAPLDPESAQVRALIPTIAVAYQPIQAGESKY